MNKPTLSARSHRIDDAVVVRLTGEVDVASAVILDDAVTAAAAEAPDPGSVVVDLSGVSFMDSSGVNALLDLHRFTAPGLRVLAPANSPSRKLIELCGVADALNIVDSC